jgi:hypothetical protein
LILDGCRVDAIEEVANEYAFLDNPGTMRSVTSTSIEWMEKTFTDEYEGKIENTAYVTANQHSSSVRNLPFVDFEPVYDNGWDSELDAIPADVVTDVAIEVGRKYSNNYDRMIVHYMQPHSRVFRGRSDTGINSTMCERAT